MGRGRKQSTRKVTQRTNQRKKKERLKKLKKA